MYLSHLKNHKVILKIAGWSFLLLSGMYFVFSMSGPIIPYENIQNFPSFMDYLASLSALQKSMLAFMALMPLLLISAGMGVYSAVRPYAPYFSGFMLICFVFSFVGYTVSLARWYVVNLMVADVWHLADLSEKENLRQLVLFLDHYFGDVFGICIGEGFLSFAFCFMAISMFKSKRFPKWLISLVSLVSVWLFVSLLRVFFPYMHAFYTWGELLMILPLCFLALAFSMFFFRKPREKRLATYHPKFQKKELLKKDKKQDKTKPFIQTVNKTE